LIREGALDIFQTLGYVLQKPYQTKERKGKRMKREARWENSGRDGLSLQKIMEMYEDGYEFVVQAGHVVAVLVDF